MWVTLYKRSGHVVYWPYRNYHNNYFHPKIYLVILSYLLQHPFISDVTDNTPILNLLNEFKADVEEVTNDEYEEVIWAKKGIVKYYSVILLHIWHSDGKFK